MNPKAGNVKKNNRYYHIYLYNKCLSTMYSKRRISFSVRGISVIIGELMLQVHCTRRTAIAGKKSGLASAAFFILKEMFRCGSWENKKTMTLCLLIIVLFRWKEVIVSKKHLLKTERGLSDTNFKVINSTVVTDRKPNGFRRCRTSLMFSSYLNRWDCTYLSQKFLVFLFW